jgi:hypothetical protein
MGLLMGAAGLGNSRLVEYYCKLVCMALDKLHNINVYAKVLNELVKTGFSWNLYEIDYQASSIISKALSGGKLNKEQTAKFR